MLRGLWDRKQKPKQKPTHDLFCECGKCVTSTIKYIKALKKVWDGPN